ncbi:hypothetical protein [Alteribacter natronophilus]|uniref:hypothetical protein n=1 Tax=Alteribacter natronophilus TaxID=2583810 RepID=UPI00110F23CD|nr:hypothetical protein [Alteribacter natronophilus]TMW71067.1 hypothetical protein FGB90_13950 [Alteribacter natronophilus]
MGATVIILSVFLFFTAYMLGIRRNMHFLHLFIPGLGGRVLTGDRDKVAVRFAFLSCITGGTILIHFQAGPLIGSAAPFLAGALILAAAIYAYSGLLKYGFQDQETQNADRS